MAPTKISSLASFPPVSSNPSGTHFNLLPRHTPLSPVFASLLCSTCSTLRLSLLRNGYAQTSIYSRTEVLHSATVCRMCRLILMAIENRFEWMEQCSVDPVHQHVRKDRDLFGPEGNEYIGCVSSSANNSTSDLHTKMDSCALPRGATIHIRAQSSPTNHSASTGTVTSQGVLANIGGLGIEVVVFGNTSVDELAEENLCVWHSNERLQRESRVMEAKFRINRDRERGQSGDEFEDARAPTPPAKDFVITSNRQAEQENIPYAKVKTLSPQKVSQNAVFHSARRWLLEVSQAQPTLKLPLLESGDESFQMPEMPRGFPGFLIDVSYPPRLLLVRTASIVAERGKVPRYAALSHCSEIQTSVGIDEGINPRIQHQPIIEPDRTSKAINWAALPVIAQHAALATRALKLRYLWVRELCPAGSGRSNFSDNKEGDNPAFAYLHSFLTLAVHSSDTTVGFLGKEVGGFLDSGPSSRLSYSDFVSSTDTESILLSTSLGLLARVVSAHIIHFAPGRIYFEDTHGVRSPSVEGVRLRNLGPGMINTFQLGPDGMNKCLLLDRVARRPEGMVPASFGGRPAGKAGLVTSSEWFDLLERFSGCPDSEDGIDRLEVLEWMMQLIGPETRGGFSYGVWTGSCQGRSEVQAIRNPNTDLAKTLLWKCTVQPALRAKIPVPSWSWASLSEAIQFPDPVLMSHDGKGEIWSLGADDGNTSNITLENAKSMLSRNPGIIDITPRVDSVGSQRPDGLLLDIKREPGSQFDLPQLSKSMMEKHSRRLIIAGLLIPVRLSRRCYGTQWVRSDRIEDGPGEKMGRYMSTIRRPQFKSNPSVPILTRSSALRGHPSHELRDFPTYLHPPGQMAYRGVYGTTTTVPGGPKTEILIGWCVLDDEKAGDTERLWVGVGDEIDASEGPELAILHVTAGYGLLVQRKRSLKRARPRSHIQFHDETVTDRTGGRLRRDGSDTMDSRSLYSRLATGRMGKTLSLARIKEEMGSPREGTRGVPTNEGDGKTLEVNLHQPLGRRLSQGGGEDEGSGSSSSVDDFPSYIRLGFIKLDDRLVDRSLNSGAMNYGHPTQDQISVAEGRNIRSASSMKRFSVTVVPGAGDSTRLFNKEMDTEKLRHRNQLLTEVDELIQGRLDITERMKRIGTQGFVIGLV